MKKITKMLSLLLAGLLSVSTFLACSDSGFGIGEDDEKESTDFSDYEDLSPEEVLDALEDAPQLKITLKYTDGSEKTITKDGKKAKLDAHGSIVYFDYKNELQYTPDANGSYSTESWESDWEDLLSQELAENFFQGQNIAFFLDKDSYEDEDDDVFSISDDVLEDAYDTDEVDVKAYMEREDTTYTFVCKVDDGEGKTTTKCEIEFNDFTVKLPDAEGPSNTGVERPITTTAQTPSTMPPVTQPPPATTQKPETTVPTPEFPENVATPEELYESLLNATDATISLKYSVDGVTYQVSVEKDGSVYSERIYASNAESDYICYYDEYYLYEQGNDGNWYYQPDTTDWAKLLSELDEIVLGLLTTANEHFYYDSTLDKIVMSDALVADIGWRSVTIKQSGNSYIYSIVHQDFSTSTINIKFSVFSAIKIPNAQPAPTGNTEYANMAPSEIYNALVNSDNVYMSFEIGDQFASYSKSGDILCIYAVTPDREQTVYVDFSTQTGYSYQNGQWVTERYTNSWASILEQASITSSTYFFNDSYYNSFSEADQLLTIRSDLFSDPTAALVLYREGVEYSFQATSGTDTSYFDFSFAPIEVNLPN